MTNERRLIDANDAYKYARSQYRDEWMKIGIGSGKCIAPTAVHRI